MLYELDGKPALALYKDYLASSPPGCPRLRCYFPLAIRHAAASDDELVRTVSRVDERRSR